MTIQIRASNHLVCGVTVFAARLGREVRGKRGRAPLRAGRLCGCEAKWTHPRWPQGGLCDRHREALEAFFPDGWKAIAETTLQRS